MHTIDTWKARKIAADWVREIEDEVGCILEIIDGSTVEVKRGWLFFYNSADFIRTGNNSDALAGNGPLFVSLDGELTELPTSMPWQQALDELT